MGTSLVNSIKTRAADADRGSAPSVVSRTVTDEVENYNSTVAGIDIEAVRAGPGGGPTQILAATGNRFTFTSSKLGFPMLSRTTIPDHMVVMAYIQSTPPGSRWCEIDLEPGAIIVESPGCEHTARNRAGLDFMFAIAVQEQIERYANQLGLSIKIPRNGEAHLVAKTPKTGPVAQAFSEFARCAGTGEYPSAVREDDVLRAMTHALSEQDRVRQIGCTKWIDSRRVVHACIDYAHMIDRIPPISELCLAAHVSERRLREAFIQEFDLPPSRFFKIWALDEAHRRLSHNATTHETVTDIAVHLGFDHLGRFSHRYKEIYGQTPSTTLHTAHSAEINTCSSMP
jgi:AraC-like DNA-binding protein